MWVLPPDDPHTSPLCIQSLFMNTPYCPAAVKAKGNAVFLSGEERPGGDTVNFKFDYFESLSAWCLVALIAILTAFGKLPSYRAVSTGLHHRIGDATETAATTHCHGALHELERREEDHSRLIRRVASQTVVGNQPPTWFAPRITPKQNFATGFGAYNPNDFGRSLLRPDDRHYDWKAMSAAYLRNRAPETTVTYKSARCQQPSLGVLEPFWRRRRQCFPAAGDTLPPHGSKGLRSRRWCGASPLTRPSLSSSPERLRASPGPVKAGSRRRQGSLDRWPRCLTLSGEEREGFTQAELHSAPGFLSSWFPGRA